MIKKYQNVQFWAECQLVSIWNAARFHNINPPEIKSWGYALIVIDSGGIYGSCINTKKELKRLKLKCVSGKWSLNWIRKNLPVELSLFTPHRGFHSVLCVNVKGKDLLLTNYTRHKLQWLSWHSIKKMKYNYGKPVSIQLKNKKD